MNPLIEKLRKYLEETLGIESSILLLGKEGKTLPFFLSDAYDFFEISLLSNRCLLMISKENIEMTPSTIQKHWEQVAKKWNIPCIYVAEAISSYNRKRLIQGRIPFIIPGNQIYLPDLGIDLREHFKQQKIHKELFSPATQVVIISILLGEKRNRFIPSELAHKLHYSPMTMTRVFNELEAAGIHKFINKGKERCWMLEGTKRDLWEQTNSMLRSPVRRREWMKRFPGARDRQLPLSGLSALAEITLIHPPALPIYAMGVEEYLQNDIPKGLQFSPADEAELELEIWNYDPKLFSKDGRIDPISLYLSLRESRDERIELALEELMEKIEW